MILTGVTMTGADESILPGDLVALSKRYPFVEWGILTSQSHMRAGHGPRFPGRAWMQSLLEVAEENDLRLSLHLCGGWVRDLCDGRATFAEDYPELACGFDRLQLNFHAQQHAIRDSLEFVEALNEIETEEVIVQMDGVNEDVLALLLDDGQRASPLYDLSHGGGVLPEAWPVPAEPLRDRLVGFAGGLSPENVTEQLRRIRDAVWDGQRAWIDAETHLRSDGDRLFDLAKVERFLAATQPWIAVERD